MNLIAKKPCSFGGRIFYIGDEIPSEFVVNPKAQEKIGVIAIAASGGALNESPIAASFGQVEFTIPINHKNGKMQLSCNEEQIAKVAEIMQMPAGDAKEAIRKVKDEKILIVLNACDSRKAVKDATEAAADHLGVPEETQEESAGEE